MGCTNVHYGSRRCSQLLRALRSAGGEAIVVHGGTAAVRAERATGLAAALRRPLHRVDLSRVVSTYIGETEKNLSRVFDRAENRDWVLFFDEADALFGRRTSVRDAHDKYADLEVSALLQRVERYPGLSVISVAGVAPLQALCGHVRAVVKPPWGELKRPLAARTVPLMSSRAPGTANVSVTEADKPRMRVVIPALLAAVLAACSADTSDVDRSGSEPPSTGATAEATPGQAALVAEGALGGSYFVSGPIDSGDLTRDSTHFYVWMEGESAEAMFRYLPGEEWEDPCAGEGAVAKSHAGVQCTARAGRREYRCYFAVDLPEGQLRRGVTC